MATKAAHHAAVLRTRDFTGRDVLDANGDKVGTVRDILLDRRTGAVRFVEVTLGVFRKQVIIPVEHVDWGERAFVVRHFSADAVGRLPAYDAAAPLTEDVLTELEWAYPRFYGDPDTIPDFDDREPQIVPLRDTRDFKIPRNEPDLRGWSVFGADGERVGKVTDLLVDPAAMKVGFLSVDLHDDLFGLKDDRHVLVPAQSVDLRPRGHDVWVRGMEAREIARLPAYPGGAVDPLVVRTVTSAFESARGRVEPVSRGISDDETMLLPEEQTRLVAGGAERDVEPAGDTDAGEVRFVDESSRDGEVRR